MIPQKKNNNGTSHSCLLQNLLLVLALIATLLTACDRRGSRNSNVKNKDTTINPKKAKTFQELGFFGNIKEDKWDSFINAVKNNIANSRKEPGNLSFSLYRSENGGLQPIWFERFKNKDAHNHHKAQHYFKDAIAVIQKSLKGEARSIELEEIDKIPVVIPTPSDRPEMTRHVIVLFHVKPEKRQPFIDGMAGVAAQSRQAQGNLEFNIYQYADDPNKFVLMEGWKNPADHEAQLKQDYIKRLHVTMVGFFVSNPMDNHWLVKDISQ
ncbi:quinol monooxygenase YgiN [Pedobacter metabolipauper]|uniref:Quinol monooxygenase YgiN n=2 Tax=Pedobacter metabolipauper TaxID=425513 RepID=A0A4R6STB3_9SPHI|nr:quinol monooxygenase YgiN [Pedobacter metabolipauper]